MWKAGENIVWRDKGDTCVLLNTKDGHYYTLNPTAAQLWAGLIGKNRSLDDAAGTLAKEATGAPDADAVLADCRGLLDEWLAEGLVVEQAAP